MEFGRLSVEEAERFSEDGFLFKRRYFDREEIALVHRAIGEDKSLKQNLLEMPDPEWGKTELALWNHPGDDLLGAIARCTRIVGAMELLLGGEVYHYHSKLTAKPPRTGGGFRWHQDFGYWYDNGILFPDLASVMIAVDPMTVENGCLQVLKGSNRLGRLNHVAVGGQMGADPERVDEAKKVLERVHCELEPGDCLFLHCNTLHSSAPNRSESPRTALLCCYNAARNNPFRAHHHPSYTPLDTLPDEAVKARGHVLEGAKRAYMTPESVETHDIRITSKAEGAAGS